MKQSKKAHWNLSIQCRTRAQIQGKWEIHLLETGKEGVTEILAELNNFLIHHFLYHKSDLFKRFQKNASQVIISFFQSSDQMLYNLSHTSPMHYIM